jgi:two-component system, OmpR family, sensor histidine kinase CiaH
MKFGAFYSKHKLAIVTWVYWFLLLYTLAALVWWFVELLQQNNEMYSFKKELIAFQDPNYQSKINFIELEKSRNVAQYLGEGIIFMLIMLIGAVFVYRAVRKQILLNEQQQNFMMAITHELKTPIAITRLNLETLQKRKLEPSQQEKIFASTLQETDRLNDLCNNILLAAQIESGKYFHEWEDVNISELASSSIAFLQSRFPKRTVTGNIDPGISIPGDRLMLHLLFNNIVENALKYSPIQSPVHVSLEKGPVIKLSVIDQGSGIPDNEKKKIFGKFYRTGNENTRKTKGTGLGLYLSRKIAEDHGAIISVRDNRPTGSIFVIEFNMKQK